MLYLYPCPLILYRTHNKLCCTSFLSHLMDCVCNQNKKHKELKCVTKEREKRVKAKSLEGKGCDSLEKGIENKSKMEENQNNTMEGGFEIEMVGKQRLVHIMSASNPLNQTEKERKNLCMVLVHLLQ